MTPRGWLFSLILLAIGLAVGIGAGRVLGDTPGSGSATTTTTVLDSLSTAPVGRQPDVSPPTVPGPTLRDLVPDLTAPLFIETANPSQLLRWDLGESQPRRVANVPSGSDIAMDRDARFVLVSVPSASGTDRLLGGLAGAELTTLTDALVEFPGRSDFSETVWFVDDGGLVSLDLRTNEQRRFSVPSAPVIEQDAPQQVSGPRLERADDTSASFSTFFTYEATMLIGLTLVDATGETFDVSLPDNEAAYVAGRLGDTIFVRSFDAERFGFNRTSGEMTVIGPDGSCGPIWTSPADGTAASVCGGVVLIDRPEALRFIGPWETGRWSGSGSWFMAAGWTFGDILLVDAATGVDYSLPFDLPDGARFVDVWSGA